MADNVTLKPNGWNEWAKYVLISIETQSESIKELDNKLDEVKLDLREIKTKVAARSATIGAVLGVVLSVASYLVIELIKNAAQLTL